MYEKKAAILQYVFLNLNDKTWISAIRAITYYKKMASKPANTAHAELDLMIVDVNRAFVLYCTTMVNKMLAANQGDKAVSFAVMAAYDTLQLIDENDLHYA